MNPGYLDLVLMTNIPCGSASWHPISVGNVWQYDYSTSSGVYFTQRYAITDSFSMNDIQSYSIRYDSISNGSITNTVIDTIYIDAFDNIVFINGDIDFPHFEYYVCFYYVGDYSWDSGVEFIKEGYDQMPGHEGITTSVFNLGLHVFATGDEYGWSNLELVGARIGDTDYGVYTPLSIKENNAFPSKYAINVYPNPFNNKATLNINTPVSENISISIINILGQEVFHHDESYFNKGNHIFQIDSKSLSSGPYIVILNSNEKYFYSKFTLLK